MKKIKSPHSFLYKISYDHAEQAAVIIPGYKLNYQQFYHLVYKTKHRLQASGFRKGDRLGIISENNVYYIILLMACWQCGIITIPLSTHWPLKQIEVNLKKICCQKIILSSKNVPSSIIGEPLRDALIIDLKYNRFTVLPVKKNKKCIVCGEDGLVREKSIRLEEPYRMLPSLEKLLDKLSKANKLIRSEYSILIEDGTSFKKVEKDRWDEAFKLARGKYIYVIFKSKASDEYKEVVVKVHN